MNIEGAVVHGEGLRLLQRGIGERGGKSWTAILDLSRNRFVSWLDGRNPLPPVRRVLEIDLGAVAGVSLGFTDAAVTGDGRVAFLACAEDTRDALNDGPVLAGADVSFTFGRSVPLAQSKADFVILGEQLMSVVQALALSRRTMSIVRQNLWWALLYNAACVPLAVVGLLPAWLAGLGMATSSLLVVLNALRLARAPSLKKVL